MYLEEDTNMTLSSCNYWSIISRQEVGDKSPIESEVTVLDNYSL